MIPEFFVLVSFFYHFGWVANLIIKRANFLQNLTLINSRTPASAYSRVIKLKQAKNSTDKLRPRNVIRRS